jgi:TctA family transporter
MNLYRVIYWMVITGIVALISYQYYHYNQLTFDLFIRLCVVWGFIGWIIEFWIDDFIRERKYKKWK